MLEDAFGLGVGDSFVKGLADSREVVQAITPQNFDWMIFQTWSFDGNFAFFQWQLEAPYLLNSFPHLGASPYGLQWLWTHPGGASLPPGPWGGTPGGPNPYNMEHILRTFTTTFDDDCGNSFGLDAGRSVLRYSQSQAQMDPPDLNPDGEVADFISVHELQSASTYGPLMFELTLDQVYCVWNPIPALPHRWTSTALYAGPTIP